MTSAIEDTPGISLQEYSTLAQAAQTDPQLVDRFNSYVQELAPPVAQ